MQVPWTYEISREYDCVLYSVDIKLTPPDEFSVVPGQTENNTFRPERIPTIYNNTFFQNVLIHFFKYFDILGNKI